ncbi:hypothetical protein D5071_05705 [Pectobacterium carotovorum]|uniref:MacB-like periplasmic core domain-containing protein n=2 Tax=Pectobacterium carotovorum TaxID=554 RepID=A0A419AZ49_PECCA|nr:hypothetical protein D5071_05705 [Pectobacterium carotovorum]
MWLACGRGRDGAVNVGVAKLVSQQKKNAGFRYEPSAGIVVQAQALHDVEIVTPRLGTDVLITNGDAQMSSHIVGIDPDKEAVLSSAIQLLQGSNLFPEQQDGVLLGGALAKALKVQVGDSLTLLGTAANQTINAMDVTVIGIVTTGVQERDLRTAYAKFVVGGKFSLE